MSYVTDKFHQGEVYFRGNVAGWYVGGEFRPLMDDAVQELFERGWITAECVAHTNAARNEQVRQMLDDYAAQQERFWNDPEFEQARQEQLAEMRAAFGPGATVVNAITGKETEV